MIRSLILFTSALLEMLFVYFAIMRLLAIIYPKTEHQTEAKHYIKLDVRKKKQNSDRQKQERCQAPSFLYRMVLGGRSLTFSKRK